MGNAPAYFGLLCCLFSAPAVWAAESVAIEKVLGGLTNPSGVAIRPGDSPDRYEIFVADSGALRIVRMWSNEQEQSADAISGFPEGHLGDGPLRAGPIALLFLDRNQLAVGTSGEGDAAVRIYELQESETMNADRAKQKVAIPGGADHIYSLVRTRSNQHVPDALIVAAFRNDRSGRLQQGLIRAGTLGELKPFAPAANGEGAEEFADVALAEHDYIVGTQVGALDQPRDSRLSFYDPILGKRTMDLPVALHDIVGIAYSPKTGNLYAIDIAWIAPEEGGVYRIDQVNQPGEQKCTVVKIADIDRPGALAFGPDGTLYVASWGKTEDEGSASGALWRLRGDL